MATSSHLLLWPAGLLVLRLLCRPVTSAGNAIEDDLEAMDNIETFLVRNLGILAADEDDDTYDPLPSG